MYNLQEPFFDVIYKILGKEFIESRARTAIFYKILEEKKIRRLD